MAYSAEISRSNPTLIAFVVDQSGSMSDSWSGDSGRTKAAGVATILNRLLQNLVLKCTKGEEVRDYFYIAAVGYGSHVRALLPSGPADAGAPDPISWIADHTVRVEERTQQLEDGIGGIVSRSVKFPIWLDPESNGGTPMCAALAEVGSIVDRWVNEHPDSHPPMVINITDGESTDGDPTVAGQRIRQLNTHDGATLLFNIHISANAGSPILFPSSAQGLPDEYARTLFAMSSDLPPQMQLLATQEGLTTTHQSKGFVFNADPVSLIRFLDIGTRPANLR